MEKISFEPGVKERKHGMMWGGLKLQCISVVTFSSSCIS